jgi:hypothetical protein
MIGYEAFILNAVKRKEILIRKIAAPGIRAI